MGKIKKVIILICIIIPIILTGCWDKVEINERAFVTAVGIDILNEKETGEEKDKTDKKQSDRYLITYILPNIEAIGKEGQGEPVFIVSSKGRSPYETTRQLTTRVHQILFFSHMKILVIGEDVAKNSDMLREILDSLERNYAISRRIHVLVAKGTAKEILNVDSQYEADIGIYLSRIFENAGDTAIFNPLTLGDLLQNLHDEKNALMPRVAAGEDDVKVSGSGVIKNYKLIGWLEEIENRSVMFLKDMIKSDLIVVTATEDNILVPYEVTQSKTDKNAKIEDGRIKVRFMIEMEGDLRQFKMDRPEDVLDDKFLKKLESVIESYFKTQIENTVKKLQKEFKVDVIGVNEYLSKFKPDIWSQFKDDWENVFPDIDIQVEVDSKIRRIGITK